MGTWVERIQGIFVLTLQLFLLNEKLEVPGFLHFTDYFSLLLAAPFHINLMFPSQFSIKHHPMHIGFPSMGCRVIDSCQLFLVHLLCSSYGEEYRCQNVFSAFNQKLLGQTFETSVHPSYLTNLFPSTQLTFPINSFLYWPTFTPFSFLPIHFHLDCPLLVQVSDILQRRE